MNSKMIATAAVVALVNAECSKTVKDCPNEFFGINPDTCEC